jgi:hypothetical protein
MKLWLLSLISTCAIATVLAADKESRFFELRIYYAAPGKLDDLQARFRDHTCKLFEKHGIANIGYWTPVTNTEYRLIYLLAFPNREAREKSWKEFGADAEWQSVAKETEKNGRLVSKVESIYLQPISRPQLNLKAQVRSAFTNCARIQPHQASSMICWPASATIRWISSNAMAWNNSDTGCRPRKKTVLAKS